MGMSILYPCRGCSAASHCSSNCEYIAFLLNCRKPLKSWFRDRSCAVSLFIIRCKYLFFQPPLVHYTARKTMVNSQIFSIWSVCSWRVMASPSTDAILIGFQMNIPTHPHPWGSSMRLNIQPHHPIQLFPYKCKVKYNLHFLSFLSFLFFLSVLSFLSFLFISSFPVLPLFLFFPFFFLSFHPFLSFPFFRLFYFILLSVLFILSILPFFPLFSCLSFLSFFSVLSFVFCTLLCVPFFLFILFFIFLIFIPFILPIFLKVNLRYDDRSDTVPLKIFFKPEAHVNNSFRSLHLSFRLCLRSYSWRN